MLVVIEASTVVRARPFFKFFGGPLSDSRVKPTPTWGNPEMSRRQRRRDILGSLSLTTVGASINTGIVVQIPNITLLADTSNILQVDFDDYGLFRPTYLLHLALCLFKLSFPAEGFKKQP